MFFRKAFSPLQPVPAAGKGAQPGVLGSWLPPAPRDGRRGRRALKIAIASSVFGAGAAALLSGHGKIASNNAVISTNLVSLRAPVEGIVSGLPKNAGVKVRRGELIAHIENPRVEDQRLVDLREQQKRIDAELKAAKVNRDSLLKLRAELIERDLIHTKANSERLARLVEEAEKMLSALAAKEDEAQEDVDRRTPLEARGIVPRAEMKKLRSKLEQARQEKAAQAERVAALRAEAEAAGNGVLAGITGGSDKSYSRQRADEVAIQLSSLEKAISTLRAQGEETSARLTAENRRIALLRSADILAPAPGMIWKIGAADGERLGIGDMAAEIVDCDAPFPLAAIPQDRFSDVEVGGHAKFRLSGERTERTGTVMSVTGRARLMHEQHYAALPLDEPSTVIVTVAMDRAEAVSGAASADECLTGRSARVLLPANGGGLIDQILRRVL